MAGCDCVISHQRAKRRSCCWRVRLYLRTYGALPPKHTPPTDIAASPITITVCSSRVTQTCRLRRARMGGTGLPRSASLRCTMCAIVRSFCCNLLTSISANFLILSPVFSGKLQHPCDQRHASRGTASNCSRIVPTDMFPATPWFATYSLSFRDKHSSCTVPAPMQHRLLSPKLQRYNLVADPGPPPPNTMRFLYPAHHSLSSA